MSHWNMRLICNNILSHIALCFVLQTMYTIILYITSLCFMCYIPSYCISHPFMMCLMMCLIYHHPVYQTDLCCVLNIIVVLWHYHLVYISTLLMLLYLYHHIVTHIVIYCVLCTIITYITLPMSCHIYHYVIYHIVLCCVLYTIIAIITLYHIVFARFQCYQTLIRTVSHIVSILYILCHNTFILLQSAWSGIRLHDWL